MRARHKDAKGTQYSYEDHYEDDDYMNSYDDSYTPSMGSLLVVLFNCRKSSCWSNEARLS